MWFFFCIFSCFLQESHHLLSTKKRRTVQNPRKNWKRNVFKRKSYDSGVWMQSQSNQLKIIFSERLVSNEHIKCQSRNHRRHKHTDFFYYFFSLKIHKKRSKCMPSVKYQIKSQSFSYEMVLLDFWIYASVRPTVSQYVKSIDR